MNPDDLIDIIDSYIKCTHCDMGGFEKNRYHVSSTDAKNIKRLILEYRELRKLNHTSEL